MELISVGVMVVSNFYFVSSSNFTYLFVPVAKKGLRSETED